MKGTTKLPMTAKDLSTAHEVLMPDGVSWRKVAYVHPCGSDLFIGLVPNGSLQLRRNKVVTAREHSSQNEEAP